MSQSAEPRRAEPRGRTFFLVVLASFAILSSGDPAPEQRLVASRLPLGWWKLDEGAGDSTRDDGREIHEGGFLGEPLWSAGLQGSALAFDEPGARFRVKEAASARLRRSFTATAWVQAFPRAKDDAPGPVILGWDGSFSLRFEGGSTRPELLVQLETSEAAAREWVRCSAVDEIDSGWHDLAGTFSSSERRLQLFVDGDLAADCPFAAADALLVATNSPLEMGGVPQSSTPLHGVLDDLRLYDRVLDVEEIQALLWSPVEEPPPPPEEVTAPVDASGNVEIRFTQGPDPEPAGFYVERLQGNEESEFQPIGDLASEARLFHDRVDPRDPPWYRLRSYGPGGFSAPVYIRASSPDETDDTDGGSDESDGGSKDTDSSGDLNAEELEAQATVEEELALPKEVTLPSVSGIENSEFTGAATASVPIQLPKLPAGFPLSLSLSYSSEIANTIRSSIEAKGLKPYQLRTHSGVYGLGWSLSGIPAIAPGPGGPFADRKIPHLNLGGSFLIRYDPGTRLLQTQPLSFDHLEINASPDGLSEDHYYWGKGGYDSDSDDQQSDWYRLYHAWDRSGTRYTFQAQQRIYNCARTERNRGWYAIAFYVSEIEDVHGNRALFHYFREKTDNGKCRVDRLGENHRYDRGFFPRAIEFFPRGASAPTVRIDFEAVKQRPDGFYFEQDQYRVTEEIGAPIYSKYRITAINVSVRLENGAFATYRRYELDNNHAVMGNVNIGGTPADESDYGHMLLKGVRILGRRTGTDIHGSPTYASFPSYRFTYSTDPAPAHPEWNYARLTAVDNGYGGRVVFQYTTVPMICSGRTLNRFAVSKVQTFDGVEPGPASVIDYQYFSPECRVDQREKKEPKSADAWFLGYGKVVRTERHPDAPMGDVDVETDYHVSQQKSPFGLIPHAASGRPHHVLVRSQGSVVQESTTTWAVKPDAIVPPGFMGLDWLRKDAESQTTGGRTRLTQYVYSNTSVWPFNYGLPDRILSLGDPADPRDDVTTQRTYLPPGPTHLLGLVSKEEVFGWDGVSDGVTPRILRDTRFFYDKEDPDPAVDAGTVPVLGNLTATLALNPGGSPAQVQTNFYYDVWGNQIRVKDGRGHPSSTIYDPLHHAYPVQSTNAKNQSTRNVYDLERGVVLEEWDLNDRRTSYNYDDLGRVTEIFRPGDDSGPSRRYSYSPIQNGQVQPPFAVHVSRRIDDGSAPTYAEGAYFHNGIGQKIQTQMPGDDPGQVIVVNGDYGSQGKVVRSSPPYEASSTGGYLSPLFNDPTLFEYDALGRPTKTIYPDTRVERVEYHGWDDVVFDAKNRRRERYHDAAGRLLRSIELEGASTEYTYSALGELTRVKDSAGNETVLKYDLLGRKVEMTDPDMGRWTYEYDAVGNLVRQTDPRGVSTTIDYDVLNRREAKAYSDPAAAPIRYTYDEGPNGVGKRTGMIDAAGAVSWSYDEEGHLRTESRLFLGPFSVLRSSHTPGDAYVTGFDYDAADRVRIVTYPDREQVTTEYSPRGLPRALSSNGVQELVPTALYDEQARPKEVTFGNDRVMTYAYWAPSDQVLGEGQGGRLSRLELDSDSFQMSYQYDGVGNITTVSETSASGGLQTQEFSYDELDRLIAASAAPSSLNAIPGYQETYLYDPLSNLTFRNGKAYLYGLDGAGPHAVGAVGSDRYQYDPNGNMVLRTEDGKTYAQGWDPENRLERVSFGAETTRFVYDGNGKRLLKVERSGARESTTVYVNERYEESFDTTSFGLVDAVVSPPADPAPILAGLRESLAREEMGEGEPSALLDVEDDEVEVSEGGDVEDDVLPVRAARDVSDLVSKTSQSSTGSAELLPLGWWKLDDSARDDGEGAHDAELSGSATWSEGKLGRALALDGKSQFVTVGNFPEYRISKALTIAAWVNVEPRDPNSNAHPAILGKAKSYALRLRSRTTRPELALHLPDAKQASQYGYVQCTADDDLAPGWHHVAGTYAHEKMRLYVDGAPVEECKLEIKHDAKGRISTGSAPLLLGRWTPNDSYLHGSLDDVRLYDRRLSDEEIGAIFSAGATDAPPAPPSRPRAAPQSMSAIQLSWSLGAGTPPAGFVLERKDAASKGLYRFLAEVKGTDRGFLDEGLPAGSAHVYRLRSFGPGGFSHHSGEAIGTTDPDPGAPPIEPPLGWWKLDENGGLVASDEQHLHDGALEGTPDWTLGKLGGGLALDGKSQFVTMGNFPEYRISKALTIAGWVNVEPRDPSSNAHPAILGKAKSYALRLRSRTTRPELALHLPDAKQASQYGYVRCTADDDLAPGWHHVAGTYAHEKMRLYVDGARVEECKLEIKHDDKGRISTGSAPLLLGRWTPNDSYLHGILDDVRLYDRKLSDEEVFQLSLGDGSGVECEGDGSLELVLEAEPNPVVQSGAIHLANEGSRDPAGGEISYRYSLDFGDGSTTGVQTPIITPDGTLQLLSESHAYVDPGLYTASYEVEVISPKKLTCRVSRDIKVVVSPHAPVGASDLYRGLRNTPLEVPAALGVLANDVDPDGDALEVQMSRLPAHGTLALDAATGAFHYVPQPDFAGVDSFSYKAFDGTLVSLPVTVTLVVDVIPSDGLLTHLRLDETGGPLAADSSGNLHDARADDAAPALGLFEGAFAFDGRKTLVEDEDGEDYLNGLSSLTVTMWIKSAKTGTDNGLMFTRTPNGKDRSLGLRYQKRGSAKGARNVIVASVETTGGVQKIESSPELQTTFWQFVVLRWESGEPLRLYVNGRPDNPSSNDSGKVGALTGATTLRLGQGAMDRNGSWDGLIDDFRVYGRALSDEEIGTLFHAGADERPPEVVGPELQSSGGDPSFVSVSDSPPSFFYSGSASGTLQVSLAVSDEGSGLESVTFPSLFQSTDGTTLLRQGERGPEVVSHEYTIRGNKALDGFYETVVRDRFGNETAGPAFRVSRDNLAPTASVHVPEIAFGSVLVSWSGEDSGGAGTRSFDVEVKEASAGSWTAWLSDTTSLQGRYRGQPDHSYLFRGRATDRVGNRSAWVTSGAVELREVQLRKYYNLGEMRVAVRRDDELFYLQGDHLGSTSLVLDESGVIASETRYLPYGEVRWEVGQSPTDFGFTGQRLEAGFGLLDYDARYYSARIGRFVSPDTLVPEPGSSQGFNRYAYVQGNPVKLIDPSGNCQGLAGGAFDACATVVLSLAAAVHKANEYREAIFFPDANTTFSERLEAAAVVGGGPVLVAGAPMLAAKALPYLYSAHASITLASAAHPTAAAAAGGALETAAECAMTGGGCNAGDYILGAATAGLAERASRPSKILAQGTPIDAPEVPGTHPFVPEPDPLTTHPLAGYAPANTPGGRYPDPDAVYDFGRGNFNEYLADNASSELLTYKHMRRLGEAPSWPKAPQKIKREFWRHFEDFHRVKE